MARWAARRRRPRVRVRGTSGRPGRAVARVTRERDHSHGGAGAARRPAVAMSLGGARPSRPRPKYNNVDVVRIGNENVDSTSVPARARCRPSATRPLGPRDAETGGVRAAARGVPGAVEGVPGGRGRRRASAALADQRLFRCHLCNSRHKCHGMSHARARSACRIVAENTGPDTGRRPRRGWRPSCCSVPRRPFARADGCPTIPGETFAGPQPLVTVGRPARLGPEYVRSTPKGLERTR
jgi:hypothetical protein